MCVCPELSACTHSAPPPHPPPPLQWAWSPSRPVNSRRTSPSITKTSRRSRGPTTRRKTPPAARRTSKRWVPHLHLHFHLHPHMFLSLSSLHPVSTYCSEVALISSCSWVVLALHIFFPSVMLFPLYFSCILSFRYVAAIHVFYFILVLSTFWNVALLFYAL